jgi:hypothetical protein
MNPFPITAVRNALAVLLLALSLTSTGRAQTAVPQGLAMTDSSPDSITLSWYRPPEDSGVSAYNIYMAPLRDGPYSKIATVTDRTFTAKNLPAGTSYFYKVTATNAWGDSALSDVAAAFTIAPWTPARFPVKIAKNMCVSLGAKIIATTKPLSGTLENLVDGWDSTGCRLRKACDLKIRLNPEVSITDADYLMIHFRTDCGPIDWSNSHLSRTLKQYTIIESLDSTDGSDGTWTEVVSGSNRLLDGVIVIPNHQPKWVGIRSNYSPNEEVPKASDRRPMPSDLILCRLDVFRSAPAGQRNDFWIFTGDSLVMQDLPGGKVPGRTEWFSDIVRRNFSDRYPIVVHSARGGEMNKNTLARTTDELKTLSPENGTATPTATIVCWESGYNDVGVGGSLGFGASLIPQYEAALKVCRERGLVMVPVRIQYSTHYLNPATLEPAQSNVFVNSLAVNLGGVDVFARKSTPYACDPATHRPYADYWTFTRDNHATALSKDGVHHTKEGSDGINRLWADVAERMIYTPQSR